MMMKKSKNTKPIKSNGIYQGNALEIIETWPDDFIDTIITSPPYWGLRDYGVKGQIGLESTLEEYLDKLLDVTAELQRVLKPTGVMFWNHGDCYGGSCSWGGQSGLDPKYSDKRKVHPPGYHQRTAAPKCLTMQNYRLILRMIDEQDWILRNTIIWHKPNAMPSSVKDRFVVSHEPVFMLVKDKKYWFDQDAIRVPYDKPLDRWAGEKLKAKGESVWDKGTGQEIYRDRDMRPNKEGRNPRDVWEVEEELKSKGYKINQMPNPKRNWKVDENPKGVAAKWKQDLPRATHPGGRNPRDVWKIPTRPKPFKGIHFAVFPEKLVEPMIKATCPEWICGKCGKARVRITEPTKEYAKRLGKSWHNHSRDREVGGSQKSDGGITASYQTVGWSDCGCKLLACDKCGFVLEYSNETKADNKVQEVRKNLPRKRQVVSKDDILREEVQFNLDRTTPSNNKGLDDDTQGIQNDSDARTSQLHKGRLYDGTQVSNGEGAGALFERGRDSSSQKRNKRRQSSRELSSDKKEKTRQPDEQEQETEANNVPTLRRENNAIEHCPKCKAPLSKWRSGVILDPFMGSGTVAVVANRLRRDWLGVELSPKFVKLIEKRVRENPKPMV